MKITVSDQSFDLAQKTSGNRDRTCPIAQEVKKRLGRPVSVDNKGVVRVYDKKNRIENKYQADNSGRSLISLFDSGYVRAAKVHREVNLKKVA